MDISCTSTGVPVPTISWILNNQITPFNQTDISQDLELDIDGTLLTEGNVVSTLHIERAQYPAHDGVYECTGINSHAGVPSTSTVMITVQVQGMPILM